MKALDDTDTFNIKQPNFFEKAFDTADEKINSFRSYIVENHYRWLDEILEEAQAAFNSEENVLLPKTPSMRRKRKKNTRKASKAGKKVKGRVTDSAQGNCQSESETVHAGKRAKIVIDSNNVSQADLESNTSLCEAAVSDNGGRKLRPRKGKSAKPPMATRQSKRIAAKSKVDITPEQPKPEVIKTPTSFQTVQVKVGFIDKNPLMKTPGTPDVKKERSPLLGSVDNCEARQNGKFKDQDVAFSPLSAQLLSQKSPALPSTPVDLVSTLKSPLRIIETNTRGTPVRVIGTPTSLQPKVAAIVKQFTDFETNGQLSPSPTYVKNKGKKGRLSNKFANHKRSSILNSSKKLKRLSKRSMGLQRRSRSISKMQDDTPCRLAIPKIDAIEDNNYVHSESEDCEKTRCLFPEEVICEKSIETNHDSGINSLTSSGMDTVNESKQQLRKTFDMKASESSFGEAIDVNLEANCSTNQNKDVPNTTSSSSCNESSHTIKRKTYDVEEVSITLESVDIVIDDKEDSPRSLSVKESPMLTDKKSGRSEEEDSQRNSQETEADSNANSVPQNCDEPQDHINTANPSTIHDTATVDVQTPPKTGPRIVKGVKPSNILSGAISSFIKKVNTPKKETEEDKKRMKEKDFIKKEKMRQRNLEIMENKRKQEIEERKRRREERERRVAETQAIKAREEAEKKRALEERLKNIRDKEEKSRRMKEKEEEMKRKIRERKQAEVEARRKQEEEERKQKLLELEMEEKRKQEYLAKKTEYEEQYRAKRLMDLKRQEEQKLQEMENERRLQEERWRREIEEKSKRRDEAERKIKEDREKEKQRKEREEKERRAALGKERKQDLENQRVLYKQQRALDEREEEMKRQAELKERQVRHEKERREREERERVERELLRKEKENALRQLASAHGDASAEKKGKEREILKVVSKFIGDTKSVPSLAAACTDQKPTTAASSVTASTAAGYKSAPLGNVTNSNAQLAKYTSTASKPEPRQSSYVSYDIADMDSGDSTDDDDDPMQRVPSWAQKQCVWRTLRNPDYALLDPYKIFEGLLEPPKLERIFKKHTARFFKRTSSACWDSPILKNIRKII